MCRIWEIALFSFFLSFSENYFDIPKCEFFLLFMYYRQWHLESRLDIQDIQARTLSVQNITIHSAFLTKIVVVLFVGTVSPLVIAGTRVY